VDWLRTPFDVIEESGTQMAERLLIVDDNPFNVKLARYLLSREGFEVRAVENSNDAMSEVASWAPELVLMDLRLPGTDGLTLTRTLRADPANQSVLIVAFSAEATAEEERRAFDAGCVGYIAKPIDTRTFGATVRSFLDVARLSSSSPDLPNRDS